MNGGMDIIVNRIPNAISIPAKALFTRAGKPIVYLAENGRYRAAGQSDPPTEFREQKHQPVERCV